MLYRGVIKGFAGSWGSGLGSLLFESGQCVHCENAPTVRALEGCFGDVIGNAHDVKNNSIEGKEIVYSVGDFGLLEAFTPIDEFEYADLIPDEGIDEEEFVKLKEKEIE